MVLVELWKMLAGSAATLGPANWRSLRQAAGHEALRSAMNSEQTAIKEDLEWTKLHLLMCSLSSSRYNGFRDAV